MRGVGVWPLGGNRCSHQADRREQSLSKRPTIKDVAREAGVTIGTVSHVINGTASVSDETALRVRAVIKSLGYLPNASARNMRRDRNSMIGLLVPKLTNSYYSRIASSFMNRAADENYTVMLLSFEYSLSRERAQIMTLLENNVSTIVIVNNANDEQILRYAQGKGASIILADSESSLPGIPYIIFENDKAIHDAVGLLKSKGYRSIGYVSEPFGMVNLRQRFEGYRHALKAYGYPCRGDYVFVLSDFRKDHLEQGYIFIRRQIEKRGRASLPEALLVSSDMIAMGIIKGLASCGYEVPGDLGVIGFDDLEISSYVRPSLTTVHQDQDLLGNRLWDMAKACHRGEEVKNLRLPQQLIVRDSV